MNTSADGSNSKPEERARWRRLLDNFWIRNALGLLVLAAIVGVLVAIDRGGSSDVGALDSRHPELGKPAPDFVLRDTDGHLRRLSDYRGKVVWLNFWATWCGPCRKELPDIQRFADALKGDGLVVFAVNEEESAGAALGFWDELGLGLPILLDENGEVGRQYRRVGLPDNFFIDRDGVVRSLKFGFLSAQEMRDDLKTVGLEAGQLGNGN